MRQSIVLALFATLACSGSIGDLVEETPAPFGPGARPAPAPGAPEVAPPGPGAGPGAACRMRATPLRRLTVAEYDSTVRQLLGEGVGRPGEALPSDEAVGVYDTDVGSQGMSPLLARGYFLAAEAAAARADLGRILPCPVDRRDDACAQQFIDRFGERAFRRPLRPDEAAELSGFHRSARASFGFEEAVRLTIQLVLTLPQFLYRELTPAGPETVVRLDPFELAARLSYFLWGTMPDDELFAAARAGKLATREEVAAQAGRLLASPRARGQLRRFARQWLGLLELHELTRDPARHPGWSSALPAAMEQEALTFVEKMVFDERATFERLLTAPTSYLTPALARYLGVPAPTGAPLGKVELDPQRHSGLVTLSGPLALSATADGPNPIYRGARVRYQLLCTEVPPPPADLMVEAVPVEGPATDWRQVLAQHSADPRCASCHRLLDPIGFGLLRFDATGKWRSDRHIDTRGEIVSGGDATGPFDGAVELGRRLGQSATAAGCLATHLFRFSRGTRETSDDECALAKARALHQAAGGDLRALLVAMTQTDDFLYKTIGGP